MIRSERALHLSRAHFRFIHIARHRNNNNNKKRKII